MTRMNKNSRPIPSRRSENDRLICWQEVSVSELPPKPGVKVNPVN